MWCQLLLINFAVLSCPGSVLQCQVHWALITALPQQIIDQALKHNSQVIHLFYLVLPGLHVLGPDQWSPLCLLNSQRFCSLPGSWPVCWPGRPLRHISKLLGHTSISIKLLGQVYVSASSILQIGILWQIAFHAFVMSISAPPSGYSMPDAYAKIFLGVHSGTNLVGFARYSPLLCSECVFLERPFIIRVSQLRLCSCLWEELQVLPSMDTLLQKKVMQACVQSCLCCCQYNWPSSAFDDFLWSLGCSCGRVD